MPKENAWAFYAILLAGLLAQATADTYPSSYPFANEDPEIVDKIKTSALPKATPSFDFSKDAKDPGGYMTLLDSCDLKGDASDAYVKDVPGMSPLRCKAFRYFTNYFGGDTIGENLMYNCSAFASTLDENWLNKGRNFTSISQKIGKDGAMDGSTWCSDSDYYDCCKQFRVGKNADGSEFKISASYVSWGQGGYSGITKDFAADALKYKCSDVTYTHFCATLFTYNKLCHVNYLSESKRTIVHPCPDLEYRHLTSCKGRMLSLTLQDHHKYYEPEEYLNSMSPSQLAAFTSLAQYPDHVCHPYSYYYPSTAVVKSSSVASSASGGAASSSAPPESSASASHTSTSSSVKSFSAFAAVLSLAYFVVGF